MKKQHVKLTDQDRQEIKELLSKGTLKVRVQKRAMALQLLDARKTQQEVSKIVGISHVSISKWVSRYKKEGLAMLYDKPRSGRPIELSGEDRAKVTALACSTPPEGYARWTLRLLSDKLVELELVEAVSHTEVGRILKKTNCNLTEKDSGVSAS